MDRLRAINPLRWVARGWRNISAPGLFVASFALLIAIGTTGLMLLPNLYTGPELDFLDALFMITSAACVTGLAVVDTATYFTFWGQLWLLIFIQLGGIGLVTLTSLIIGILGRRLSLRSEMIAGPPVELLGKRDLRSLLGAVMRFTFAIEAVGAFALWLAFARTMGVVDAIWPAIFHSISAFCNAGFSLYSDSLVGFADDPAVLIFISVLVVIGGVGFLSTEELLRWWRSGGLKGTRRLSTHTFAAVSVTVALLLLGFALFGLFEWNGVLRPLGFVDKVVNAWFMSVTPRTAGFNSIPYAGLGNESAYLTILLMVVGGSPGSTAGGIKTTAMAVLLALAIQRMRGRRNAVIHHRSIPDGTVERTVSLALIAFGVMTAAIFWLSFTETRGVGLEEARAAFLPLFFEAVSAFCTVGLSMDVTPYLSAMGKFTVIVLMFVGRVGPLAFFAALSIKARSTLRDVRPAREDVIIG
ncbi:TrkH family potassium uptake protein [Vulgatibacter sp.]|uniref:TrkH family potassium uptake protein n=1 Tax=Vulgatibacter sp. TaxID=1971226 RepID=UPI003566B030